MSQPPENGPDAETQQFGAVPAHEQPVVGEPVAAVPVESESSNTRTILEIVGAVVAVGAIFMAGVLGFGAGWLAGKHDKRYDDNTPRMTMRFDGGGQGNGGGQSLPDTPSFPGFGQGGPNSDGDGSGNGANPFGGNGGGTQSMPELPDDLQQWLEQFGEQLREGMGGSQDTAPGPGAPAPTTAPSS